MYCYTVSFLYPQPLPTTPPPPPPRGPLCTLLNAVWIKILEWNHIFYHLEAIVLLTREKGSKIVIFIAGYSVFIGASVNKTRELELS